MRHQVSESPIVLQGFLFLYTYFDIFLHLFKYSFEARPLGSSSRYIQDIACLASCGHSRHCQEARVDTRTMLPKGCSTMFHQLPPKPPLLGKEDLLWKSNAIDQLAQNIKYHDVLWDPCKDSCIQVLRKSMKKLRRNAIHIFQLVWGPSARVRIKAGNPASKTSRFIYHHHTPVFQNQLQMNQFQLQHTFVRWKFDSALYSDAHSGKIREVVINALVSHRQGETTGSWMMLDGLLLSSESICSHLNALQSNDPSLRTAGSRAFGHSWNQWPRQKPQTKGSCDTGRFPVANTSNWCCVKTQMPWRTLK